MEKRGGKLSCKLTLTFDPIVSADLLMAPSSLGNDPSDVLGYFLGKNRNEGDRGRSFKVNELN